MKKTPASGQGYPPPPRLSSLEGQARAIERLRAHLSTDDIIAPMLFSGPTGVGKLTAARAFAASLLCSDRRGDDACQVCAACHRVAEASAATDLRARGGKTSGTYTYPDVGIISVPAQRARISVQQSRDLVHSMSLHPFSLSHRVYIVEPADRLSSEAANALLKVLEEPPAFGVLILVTDAPWSLPITVRSRVQELRFGALSPEVIESILIGEGESPQSARRRAERARGSLDRARCIGDDEAPRVETWLKILAQVGTMPPGALAVAAGETLGPDGPQARAALETLLEILRDLSAHLAGAPTLVLAEEQARTLLEAAPRLATDQALERSAMVYRLRREMEIFNRNPRIAVEGALLALEGTLRETDFPPIPTPG